MIGRAKKEPGCKLIVGLGNPGLAYRSTRHNIGFAAVERLARENRFFFKLNRSFKSLIASGKIKNLNVCLALPQTFMNLSGEAVKKLTIKYRIKPEDLIVIHDEMDLRLGILRIRRGGGTAGHNGVESIIRELGTADFVRVRVGVGRPGTEGAAEHHHIVGYVLGDFKGDEAEVIKRVIGEVDKAIVTLIQDGLDTAMNKFNKTNAPKTERVEKTDVTQPLKPNVPPAK